MRKQTVVYDTALDALLAVTKRLSICEDRYRMSSEDFFDRFSKGEMDDRVDFVDDVTANGHHEGRVAFACAEDNGFDDTFNIFGRATKHGYMLEIDVSSESAVGRELKKPVMSSQLAQTANRANSHSWLHSGRLCAGARASGLGSLSAWTGLRPVLQRRTGADRVYPKQFLNLH